MDKARGLVFSLDTMQSYLITKRRRHLENIPVNSFLIKLHQPGEKTSISFVLLTNLLIFAILESVLSINPFLLGGMGMFIDCGIYWDTGTGAWARA